jgi:sugar phosphate isomerase/epimerase
MIFVSTGGQSCSAAEAVEEFQTAGLVAIECSAGAWAVDLRERLRGASEGVALRLHNYFPPPQVPFVLNLGSLDDEVGRRSLEQAHTALEWSKELGSPVYSVHAGFRLDPSPTELGGMIRHRVLPDRDEVMDCFLERVHTLARGAEQLGIRLLLENNVVSQVNLQAQGEDAFLMTTPLECEEVMHRTPDNVGLLLDVAHLKVSANSLGYDPVEMFERCNDWVGAYHLSENDGESDTNEPVRKDSWFWPHLRSDTDYLSLEVYRVPTETLIEQVDLVKQQLDLN